MRQRLLSAAVGVPLIVVVLLLYNTVVLNIAMALISLLALYEVFTATKYIESRGIAVVSFVYAAVLPFLDVGHFHMLVMFCTYLYIIALFCLFMKYHKKMTLQEVGTAFMLTVMISVAFSSLVYLRDILSTHAYTKFDSFFYLALIFIGAWITDAGAYFAGRFLGKHKMALTISPKKTWEGVAGGVVASMVLFPVAGLVYQSFAVGVNSSVAVNYPLLILLGLFAAIVAIFGDLVASLIKRVCKVKDFGHILPGHGGIMDRFDSVMFVAPLIYLAIQVLQIIS